MVDKTKPDSSSERKVIPMAMHECGASVSTETMEKFIASFERSSRRWELIVYPAMFAFIVLAIYGFFLIYSLTHDMDTIARSVDNNMGKHIETLANNMDGISKDLRTMTAQIETMTSHVKSMSANVTALETLDPLLAEIKQMDTSIARLDNSVANMSVTTDLMRHDMRVMTHSVSKPFSRMNKFLP